MNNTFWSFPVWYDCIPSVSEVFNPPSFLSWLYIRVWAFGFISSGNGESLLNLLSFWMYILDNDKMRISFMPKFGFILVALMLCAYLSVGLFAKDMKVDFGKDSEGNAFQNGMALTIYNDNFALVRDFIKLDLDQGVSNITYDSATMLLEPTSVVLDPLFDRDIQSGHRHEEDDYYPKIKILEQSYRNDVLSPQYLLWLFESKEIDFLIRIGDEQKVTTGKIIRSGYNSAGQYTEPIVEIDGALRFGLPGVPLFPSLGEDTLLKPRLEWQIYAQRPFEGNARLTYITGGLRWSASYNLVLPETGDLGDLVGWVSIGNQSGRDFLDSKVELMAGQVNKVSSARFKGHAVPMASHMLAEEGMGGAVTQKAFDEFYLYSLPGKVSLRDKETKQVEFLRANNLTVKTIYRYSGQELFFGGNFMESPDVTLGAPHNVSVIRKIENSESNQLGISIPAGTFRVYRQDGQGVQFVGEDSINHTSKSEAIEITTGQAFDVLVKRVRTIYEVGNIHYIGHRNMTEGFEFTIKNNKEEDVTVNVIEYLRGPNWTITQESHKHRRTSATEVQWDVLVGANSEVKLIYRVDYKW